MGQSTYKKCPPPLPPLASELVQHHLPGHGHQPLLVRREADRPAAHHAEGQAVAHGGGRHLLADDHRPPLRPMLLL